MLCQAKTTGQMANLKLAGNVTAPGVMTGFGEVMIKESFITNLLI